MEAEIWEFRTNLLWEKKRRPAMPTLIPAGIKTRLLIKLCRDCCTIPVYAITMLRDFKPSIVAPDLPDPDAWWFIFSGYRMLVHTSGNAASVPAAKEIEEMAIDISHRVYLGRYRGRHCYAAEGRPGGVEVSDASFQELRNLFDRLECDFYEIALTGVHLVEWEKNCKFCSRCRAGLISKTDIRAKECPECGRLEFPRLSPAIIVLIEKEDTLLLARSSRFPAAFFSVLAGFVEPGESLEDAVHREVREEAGINVKNITYFGSQPWPFPDSLMIGFTAEYESGEIVIDKDEIVEAGWYKADSLPLIPGKLSIARQLIDWFVEKHQLSFNSRRPAD
jgi:NAD+ diphosphatase